MKKRFISVLLTLCMMVSIVLPTTAAAVDYDTDSATADVMPQETETSVPENGVEDPDSTDLPETTNDDDISGSQTYNTSDNIANPDSGTDVVNVEQSGTNEPAESQDPETASNEPLEPDTPETVQETDSRPAIERAVDDDGYAYVVTKSRNVDVYSSVWMSSISKEGSISSAGSVLFADEYTAYSGL